MQRDWDQLIDVSSGQIRRLSYVWRFSSIPVTVPENVAEHSYWVTLYSMLIHTKLHEGKSQDSPLMCAILSEAMVHDIAECVTGDFVRTFKYSNPEIKEAIDKAEAKEMEKSLEPPLLNIINLSSQLAENNGIDYVKAIVKAADFLSLFQFMRREWIRGNREIKEFYEIMIKDLHDMAKKQEKSEIPKAKDLADFYYKLAQNAAELANYHAEYLRTK